MKIGFDAKRYYHNHTGLGNYARSLINGLRTYCADDIECALYDAKAWTRTFRLGHRAKEAGCRLYHGLSNELPLDVKAVGLPSIVTIHDVAWRTFPSMYHWADRKLYDAKYGWAARHASCVLCISESTRRDVMRFYDVPAERTCVIYQPVASHFYTPMTPAEAWTAIRKAESERRLITNLPAEGFLLYVGSINSRKNLLSVVKALHGLATDQRPLLLVVGQGREYRQKVEQYVAAHGLQPWFHIEPHIDDNRLLQALYTACRALVYPSHYEGMGLPVIEAALQGCPVITSTVSSLPEAAGDGGLLVEPNSIEAIRESIERILTDEDLAQSLGRQGKQYALTTFVPKSLTLRLAKLYQSFA